MIFLIISIFLYIYLLIALAMFAAFLLRWPEMTMTMTKLDTEIRTEVHGWKKFKWLFICSMLWPLTIHFSR